MKVAFLQLRPGHDEGRLPREAPFAVCVGLVQARVTLPAFRQDVHTF